MQQRARTDNLTHCQRKKQLDVSSSCVRPVIDNEFRRNIVKVVCGSSSRSLLHSRSGRSHVTLLVPTRLLQTDIHSFLGVLRFCLLGPMSRSFSCHCIRCTNHRREHSQENENHTLIGLFSRKECMSV